MTKLPFSAVLLAADSTSRMEGRFKQLLPLPTADSEQSHRDAFLVPFHDGKRGNPITFAASRVPEVLAGTINPGCRKLIEDHLADVLRHDFNHDRFSIDMDTPKDYESIRARLV
jgi:CTP:molybdopterin cytidylyltransferase MocA